MSYIKRINNAFKNAPRLPINDHTKYVFFSDCHRGVGTNNDSFLKNKSSYCAALQYYFQYGYIYVEVGDGDELWENRKMEHITEIHDYIFSQLCQFNTHNHLYMLYGNHDMIKKDKHFNYTNLKFYESLIFEASCLPVNLYVTHGHQADLLNSVFWKLARFLVRYLWTPLEYFGVLDPTSAAKNYTKKKKLEKRYLHYARANHCLLLTGHTHRPTLGNYDSPFFNCGSSVHPGGITCIELCGFNISLVKWSVSAEKSGHFGNIYEKCPPTFPVYIKREVLATESLLDYPTIV